MSVLAEKLVLWFQVNFGSGENNVKVTFRS